MKIKLFFSLSILITLVAKSQNYNIATIDSILKVDANSVVRKDKKEITINSADDVTLKSVQAITIFNKKGKKHLDLILGYGPERKITKLSVIVFDRFGNEIKKINKNKFEDYSAVNNYTTLAGDNRYKAYNYENSNYPYTVEFTTEYITSNSCFLNGFYFLGNYNQSIERSEFVFNNPTNIPLNYKTYNFEEENIEMVSSSSTKLHFIATNIAVKKVEKFAPNNTIFPHVFIALEKFNLFNLKGEASTWKELGIWQNENLLKGRRNLPVETINEITALTSEVNSNIEKAKIIYKYVQDKTRYVSIQLGVGGWKPILATEVDKLGYGDCKALTNYTKALLESQNIPAYYSIVFSGENIKDYNEDLVCLQGDHVILNLPNSDGEDTWLECTSQSSPFGYISGFTDNRKVLVITPDGGEIKRTKKYTTKENLIATDISITITNNNRLSGGFHRVSSGAAYGWNSGSVKASDKQEYYKKYFNYLNNFKIKEALVDDNKEGIFIDESFNFELDSYGSKAGNKLIVRPVIFNRFFYSKIDTENRTQPLVNQRGYTYKDTYIINLAKDLNIYALPESQKIDSKFGSYSLVFEKISDQKIKIKRDLIIIDGVFKKENVKSFNDFTKKIADFDNIKCILTK